MPNSSGIVCQGWLTKSPPTKGIFRPRWRKRWFVLRTGSFPHQFLLEYYTDDSGKRLKGGINLDECEQLVGPLSVQERHKYTFQIHTPGRTYFLAADSEPEMSKWLSSLCQVCSLKSGDEDEHGGRIVYSRTGDENRPSVPAPGGGGGPGGGEAGRNNGRSQENVVNRGVVGVVASHPTGSESDESSPTLSNKLPSGPYIPISECFAGKPIPKSETYSGGLGDVTYSNVSIFQFPPKVNWATHPSKKEQTDSDATPTPTPTSASATSAAAGGQGQGQSQSQDQGVRGGGGVPPFVAPPRPPKPKKNGSPSISVTLAEESTPPPTTGGNADEEHPQQPSPLPVTPTTEGEERGSPSTTSQISPPHSAGALYCNISDLRGGAGGGSSSSTTNHLTSSSSANNSSPNSPSSVVEVGSGPPPPPVVDRNLKPPPPEARPFVSPTIANNGSPTQKLPPSYASGTMTLPSRGGQGGGSGGHGGGGGGGSYSNRHFGFGGFFAGPVIDRSRKPPEGQGHPGHGGHTHLSLGPTPAQMKSTSGSSSSGGGYPGVHHGRSMSSSSSTTAPPPTAPFNQRTLPSSSPRRAGPVLTPNEKRPFIYHEYEQAEEMKGTYLQIQCQPLTSSNGAGIGREDSPKFPSNSPNTALTFSGVKKMGGIVPGERITLRKTGLGGGPQIDPNGSVEYRLIDPVKTQALNRTIEDREKQLRNNTLNKNHH